MAWRYWTLIGRDEARVLEACSSHHCRFREWASFPPTHTWSSAPFWNLNFPTTGLLTFSVQTTCFQIVVSLTNNLLIPPVHTLLHCNHSMNVCPTNTFQLLFVESGDNNIHGNVIQVGGLGGCNVVPRWDNRNWIGHATWHYTSPSPHQCNQLSPECEMVTF